MPWLGCEGSGLSKMPHECSDFQSRIEQPGAKLGNWALGMVALAAVAASIWAAPGLPGMQGAALALLMGAVSIVDARRFIIPNRLTAAALVLALANAATQNREAPLEGVLDSLLRSVVLAGAFLAVREAHYRIRKREGIGLGDVKLAGVAGAWLGWAAMPIAVEVAALTAIAAYALRQFISGRPLHATGRIPFGLFLAPSIWLCWLLEALWLNP